MTSSEEGGGTFDIDENEQPDLEQMLDDLHKAATDPVICMICGGRDEKPTFLFHWITPRDSSMVCLGDCIQGFRHALWKCKNSPNCPGGFTTFLPASRVTDDIDATEEVPQSPYH